MIGCQHLFKSNLMVIWEMILQMTNDFGDAVAVILSCVLAHPLRNSFMDSMSEDSIVLRNQIIT